MTSHLGLDDLASLVASDGQRPAKGHLNDCQLCRDRVANLRARSADVTAALGADLAPGATLDDVGPMPADVMLRITAALTAARGVQPDEARPDEARPDHAKPDHAYPDVKPDVAHTDDLAIARERRRRRLRGWLTAAAAVVVIGGGVGAVAHYAGGQAASTSAQSGAASATDANGSESLAAGVTANPSAAQGVLLEASFTADAKAFVAAQRQVKTSAPALVPQSGGGSSRCATAATGQAAAIAGAKASGANAAVGSASYVGAVTVDGRAGVLYLVAIGPAQVAVVLSGCSSASPDVLASATL